MGIVQRYQKRISGPLMDRIDIHLAVTRVPYRRQCSECRIVAIWDRVLPNRYSLTAGHGPAVSGLVVTQSKV